MYYNNLPQEVIYHILSYTDAIKYRNGKYMNQISKTDKRYKLLLKIPRGIYLYKYTPPSFHIRINNKLDYIYVVYINNHFCKYVYVFNRGERSNYYLPK